MRRIGKWAVGLGVLALCFAAAAWRGGTAEWFLFFIVCCVIASGALIQGFALRRVRIERIFDRESYRSGDDVLVTLNVASGLSWVPVLWLAATDRWSSGDDARERFGGQYRTVLFPWFQSQITMSYRIHAIDRGLYRFGKLELETGDLFGFVTKKRTVETGGQMIVYPSLLPLVRQQSGGAQTDQVRFASVRPLAEPQGYGALIRDYVPGDPWKQIHWKNSAKLQRWQTRLPETETAETVCIVLDASEAGGLERRRFETAVSCAATLLHQMSAAGAQYSFVCHHRGQYTLRNVRGELAPETLRFLAEVDADGRGPVAALLEREIELNRRGANIVIVTPHMDETIGIAVQSMLRKGLQPELFWIAGERKEQADGDDWLRHHEWAGKLLELGVKVRVVTEAYASMQARGGVSDVSA